MIRILHAADLHLDSPFQALDREQAAARRAEQRTLLERMARMVQSRRVDLVLLAGDLLDGDSPYPETARLMEQVLSQIGVPVFIAPGNHDWYGPSCLWSRLDLGENVHIFNSEDIRCVELPALNARVWGAAFLDKHRSAPLAGFESPDKGDTMDIMVLHGEVTEAATPYGPISREDIARSGMDYIALGHVHTYSGLCRAGDTYYAWPGCPEGRGFDETGENGVLLVELEPGQCRTQFVPLNGRQYEIITVDLTDSTDHAATVVAALGRDTARDIYRIRLTGEPAREPDVPALTEALADKFYALQLRDETRLRRDVWDSRDEDSLRGLFLARLWKQYQATDEEAQRDILSRAAKYGLRALEGGDELPIA